MRTAVLDIGGTAIKSGVFKEGNLLCLGETPTEARQGGPHVMERAAAILESLLPFDGIGVSTAGGVDVDNGKIRTANENIPGYAGMEVRRILQDRFRTPVAVENDVNAAALGEAHYGAGRGTPDFLCLTYGTGVGGAIVLGGQIYHAAGWMAGDVGAMVTGGVETQGKPLEVSGNAIYERRASVTALVGMARKVDASLVDGHRIFAALDRPQVKAVVDAWLEEVLSGLLTLTAVFNPVLMVLGGGVMQQEYPIGRLRERMAAMPFAACRDVRLCQAQLGNRAGLYGAAWLAARRLEDGTP